ncbi:MAG: recombinase family protein [Candidatus Poseidonia sp.]|nr:recombinase family protein [Poseidonia sp.]
MWKGKKKAAIYLRRSKGEGGTTKAQFERIKKMVRDLEKKGKINKVDYSIVGKDINKEERFKASRDLIKKGDVFNDGEGASAFDSARDRPALNELLKRMRDGEYDIVLAETLDRYSRDPLDFGLVALDLWRRDGKIFYGLKDGRGYGTAEPFNEAIITTALMWGGESKKQEGTKATNALEAKIDRGFITSRMKAEFAGGGTKNAGLDYRRFWKIAQAYGESPEGRLNSPSKVGSEFGRDHTWASNTYEMFKQWASVKISKDMNALDAWFNTVDAINAFIREQPAKYDKVAYKSEPVQNVLSNSNGFINYPAGFSPSDKYPVAKNQFIQFPYPLDFSLEELSMTKKPNETIQGWVVNRESITPQEKEMLLKYQTQFRGKGGKGKRLV